ncbi:MAG: hypothetical protein CL610_03430 [Anaerolineaceae bacterium]|nr:hypothetical protein [Anaerolineaceae bacterium]
MTNPQLYTHPELSRFNPLPRILYYDDFDDGMHGWTQLIGNYEGSLDSILPEYTDIRPPQLSNLTMWDTGTAGSMTGSYALKMATRPKAGGLGLGIKRQTFRKLTNIQLECYLCFKPEASELKLSATDVRAFGVLFDIEGGYHNPRARWMPHLRYLNALDGQRMGKWQTKPETRAIQKIGGSGETVSHFHLGPEGWVDIPGADQIVCYNEIATKMNWSYLRISLDLEAQQFTGFQCDEQVYGPDGMQVIRMDAMPNLFNMLNVAFWVETDNDKRAFLYVDSCVLSAAEV